MGREEGGREEVGREEAPPTPACGIKSAGTCHTYYYDPCGKRFRSRFEVARHFDLCSPASEE